MDTSERLVGKKNEIVETQKRRAHFLKVKCLVAGAVAPISISFMPTDTGAGNLCGSGLLFCVFPLTNTCTDFVIQRTVARMVKSCIYLQKYGYAHESVALVCREQCDNPFALEKGKASRIGLHIHFTPQCFEFLGYPVSGTRRASIE